MKDWLERRDGERLPRAFWIALWVALSLSVLAQLVFHVHGYFGFDEWFAFNAVWGFIACLGMVLGAKLLGLLLKRREDYYHND
ncbi:MAG: hypothetical protein ACO3IJ_02935 [Steroidobacteraceae bacterium]